jgi:hypothetical protein
LLADCFLQAAKVAVDRMKKDLEQILGAGALFTEHSGSLLVTHPRTHD